MLGTRSNQTELFTAEQLYLQQVGEKSFYGFLSQHGHELFADDQFAGLYCNDNGRRSVPPSLLALTLLLQHYDNVSDSEAVERVKFDLRWQVALSIPPASAPFVKSTLQLFRSQLVLHQRQHEIFESVLRLARSKGFFKGRRNVALDTSPLLGRGAVEDTFGLLAKGARHLLGTIARNEQRTLSELATAEGLERLVASSFKGTLSIDWDDPQQRSAALTLLVQQCDRVLELAADRLSRLDSESQQAAAILSASELLSALLVQDIRRRASDLKQSAEVALNDGLSRDRVISVHDPEMRHGRKSSSKRFDGHKTSIAVEPETGMITAVAVIAGNAHDGSNADELIEQHQSTTGQNVSTVLGDGAYGKAEARVNAARHDRELLAPVPTSAQTGRFSKSDFQIDLQKSSVRCPAGHQTKRSTRKKIRTDSGAMFIGRVYRFSAHQCSECAVRDQCISPKSRWRTISVHEHEDLVQQAREYQKTEEFRLRYRTRLAVEHAFAHMMQFGLRQARYFGRAKSLFQAAMVGAIVNLQKVMAIAG